MLEKIKMSLLKCQAMDLRGIRGTWLFVKYLAESLKEVHLEIFNLEVVGHGIYVLEAATVRSQCLSHLPG